MSIQTSEIINKVRQRVGQSKFSEAVRRNYKFRCCFPECEIKDPKFLIGSHIARWVDNPDKRGNISNGLCFCVLHDKAFESGYFSLDDCFRVVLTRSPELQASQVFLKYIRPFEHKPIAQATIEPDKKALTEHRFRCKIDLC